MKTKILLVDDDPAVREMLGRVLEDQGYLVLPACFARCNTWITSLCRKICSEQLWSWITSK